MVQDDRQQRHRGSSHRPTIGSRAAAINRGAIGVGPTVAARQDEVAGHSADVELALLLTHGVLHLLGHDHAEPEEHERMFTLQAQLLQGWLAVPE